MSRDVRARPASGAVQPTGSALASLAPIPASDVTVTGGMWAERQRINRECSLPHGIHELGRAGNLTNLRLAAGAQGRFQALGEPLGLVFPFLDTDVYKWLEAAGWELGRAPDPALAREADEVIDLIAAAQRPDGYLDTYVQVVGGTPYRDLQWGHELYCIGHLVQAAVAWHRALGDDRLLAIATRAVDSAERELGPGGRDGIDGHPEVEMALVELYRATGERRHLDFAARMIELRGHGLLGVGRFGPEYWQDHAPVSQATTVAGHAVRQLYLDCGAVDVAVETGDRALLDAVRRRWRDMVATRMYLTGGLGSRHRDEAFGDPYELPPDQAYAETCAAIASVMLAWRLLLATGDPDCADVIERAVFNGVLAGVSDAGTEFFYVNTLQRRTARAAVEADDGGRQRWFACACCPPNVMRLLSSWQQHLATTDATGIQIHQYATAEVAAVVAGGPVRLAMQTDYPWSGAVHVRVLETTDQPWTLSLRIPGWCHSGTIAVGEEAPRRLPDAARTATETRTWQAGDRVVLTLDMPPRVTQPHPQIDAVRGCVALERGPLVYCIETADLPDGVEVEDVTIDPAAEPVASPRTDLAGVAIGLTARALDLRNDRQIDLAAIPYFSWGHRGVEAMRVWIPTAVPRDDRP